MRMIQFYKKEKEIRNVSEYLGEADSDPGDVGSRCFDMMHDGAGG